MACGEGYGAEVLARRARTGHGRGRQPGGARARAPQYTRPGLRFVRERDRAATEERCDALVFLQTIEHVQDPEAVLRRFGGDEQGPSFVSTPNLLTLAPPGAEQVGQPLARPGSTAPRSSARSARACSGAWSCSASSTRACCARTRSRCGSAGIACTRRSASRRPFYDRFTPAISARDFALRPDGLERALDFVAVLRP